MENNGTIFGNSMVMGSSSYNFSHSHQQPLSHQRTFFNSLGEYNVYDILPNRKKMAAILIKLSFWTANLFGISLTVYWLAIDFDMIKGFISGVGVVMYMGMKVYEKYLDIKDRKNGNPTPKKRTTRKTKT